MKLFLVASIALLLTSPVHGQEPITAARELYFAANYEDALGILGRLSGGQPSDRLVINQYRAFCLLALGRTMEAEQAIEAVVSVDPLFKPAESDASPRLRSAFSSVRARILPAIVQQEYTAAKAAFDREDFVTASAQFERVLRALGEPDLTLAASRPPLADLQILAKGFRELSMRAAAPPPAPEPPPPATVVAAPPPLKALYDGTEAGVVPPVTLRQVLPNFPRDGGLFRDGVLEVIIDQSGEVESVRMRTSINPRFDSLVLAAAKSWKYRPARFAGTPVRYSKTINISLKSSSN